jgi:hypothetical protein
MDRSDCGRAGEGSEFAWLPSPKAETATNNALAARLPNEPKTLAHLLFIESDPRASGSAKQLSELSKT